MRIRRIQPICNPIGVIGLCLSMLAMAPQFSWAGETKITAGDAGAGDQFGRSVSISGDYAIVGADNDDTGGDRSGSAYIFVRTDSGWVEQAKLTASDATSGDEFGYSVSISGDYAIVGARVDGDATEQAGSAYIFMRTDSSWVEQAKLIANDATPSDQFGWSVAISGDHAVVGAYNDDQGSAYAFMRTGSSWSQISTITASDGESRDEFGFSVAISGDDAIIGARQDDDGGEDAGAAYLYDVTALPVSVVGNDALPEGYALYHNYPNPFNPVTTIRFAIPAASRVVIKLFDILGNEIKTLVDAGYAAGEHQVRFNAGDLASGLYVYRMEAGNFVWARKLTLLK